MSVESETGSHGWIASGISRGTTREDFEASDVEQVGIRQQATFRDVMTLQQMLADQEKPARFTNNRVVKLQQKLGELGRERRADHQAMLERTQVMESFHVMQYFLVAAITVQIVPHAGRLLLGMFFLFILQLWSLRRRMRTSKERRKRIDEREEEEER